MNWLSNLDFKGEVHTKRNSMRSWIPALVFVVFAVFFILLRSKDFFTVDGAFHCFDVYHERHIFFDINNHLLYPVDVFAWTHLASAFGFDVRDPLAYFSTVEVMNCLAAAGCLAIFYSLLYLLTSSWRCALGGTIAYSLCKAFIAQATNANQPMLGIFWSFLAMLFAVLSFKSKRLWPVCVSGLLFALAMATYQSTILLAFVAVLLISLGGSSDSVRIRFDWHQCMRLSTFVVSGFAATIAIFAVAYRYIGVRGPIAMSQRFFFHEEARVYLGMSAGKLLNIPVGMLLNIFPVLPSYNGIRGLMERSHLVLLAFLLLLCLFGGLLSLCLFRVLKKWDHLKPVVRIGFLAASVGFAFTMIPVAVYDPSYDKLWIQPLACLTIFLVVGLRAIAEDSRASLLFAKIVSIVILAGLSANLVWVMRAHIWQPYEINEAQHLATMIGKNDLLVGDWDQISVLYGSLWANDDQFFSFSTMAEKTGADAGPLLQGMISETSRRGGRVYFLGILDQPKATWDSYLGSRCGVPYSTLDVYREHSSVRATFKTRIGEIPLREFYLGYQY